MQPSDRHIKSALRERIRAQRDARSTADIAAAAIAFREYVGVLAGDVPTTNATVVCSYGSFGTEPPTTAVHDGLIAKGCDVLYPVVEGDELAWADGELVPGRWGIPEPSGPRRPDALRSAHVIVLPALAVARDGARLGTGRGFYDRALAPFRSGGPLRVALVYDDEVLASLPAESHDIPVHVVVTPTRVLNVRDHDGLAVQGGD